jgi:hypothetical protein
MSTPKRTAALFGSLVFLVLLVSQDVSARPPENRSAPSPSALTVDNTTYIDANRILMFVTNHGNFGRDLGGVFGHDYGTYFPFISVEDIAGGVNISSVLYAGGLWLGGVDSVTRDTLVTVSEYSSEYVPGPMAGGTYQTDRPEFRVYKLYRDSLADNPNQDYLEWPVDQGAPVDGNGDPAMIGDQFLWTVYNDADAAQHDNNNGSTEPLRIEVQQTIWAMDQGGDIQIPTSNTYFVDGPDSSIVVVQTSCAERTQVNGHDYMVATDSTVEYGFVWHLIDITMSDTVLANQTDFSGTEIFVDGIKLQVRLTSFFKSFECVANGAGPLNPPEAAAAGWQGFPCPTGVDPDGYPTNNQQVGPAEWLFHTGDNGGTSGGGTRGSYEVFVPRTLRDNARLARLGAYDWEMRFTGSYDNPGVNGGWALNALDNYDHGYWVPFELWRIGINTPDDPSDDLRLIPWIWGNLDYSGDDNFVFDLSQYGSAADATGHDGFEHSVSGGDDDPYTDWVYWRLPEDTTPGEAGYNAFETAMKSDPMSWPGNELGIMDRTVLVNWNGGIEPPFNQDLPEQGTVFRLRTSKLISGQTFTFRATVPQSLTSGPLGMTEFLKYRLINIGNRTLNNFFISLWFDPDLGVAGDDLVGCDTLNNSFFCYNATDNDTRFGGPPPAVGFKILEGPIISSPGDTALVDGLPRPNYKNLGMYSFNKYINGTDPDNYAESYQYMLGLDPKNGGIPYINPTNDQPTRFVMSGDPVAGTGWLDDSPDDRRMMASFGPFKFRPGDTQQVVFKMAVGQGTDHLSSITSLRAVLEYDSIITDVDDNSVATLPCEFAVRQNYPNPFNPATTINYSLPERAEVEVTVFNVLGQRVTTLVRESQSAGEHSVVWNSTDNSGRSVSSGVYFYRVRAGDAIQTWKMMLLK